MTNSPVEVPNEVRDFAERSVEQARKAFEGFLSVAQRAARGEAANPGQSAKPLDAQLLAYTEQNVNAAFDLAHKLVRANDPREALALQGEYLKAQLSALQAQVKELGDVLQRARHPVRPERSGRFVPAV